MPSGPRIVIAAPDPDAAALRARLPGLGYAVCAAVGCGRRAVAETARLRPALALIDPGLAGEVSGIDAAARIGARFDVPVVFLIAAGTEELPPAARASAPFGCAWQPCADRQLQSILDTALALHRREAALLERARRLERDVTELRDDAQLFHTVIDATSDGVVASVNGKFRRLNAAAKSILGSDARPCDWEPPYGLFRPDGAPLPDEEDPLTRARLHGESADGVEIVARTPLNPDGVWLRVNARPLPGDGGVIAFRNITELRTTERGLRQREDAFNRQANLMKIVFNAISEGVIVADTDGKYLIHNAAMERIIGVYRPDADITRRSETYGIYYPDGETLYPSRELPITRAIRGESTDDVVVFIRNDHRPDGVYVSINGRPLYDEAGALIGGVIVFRDVGRARQEELEITRTTKALSKQTRAMEAVLNSLSDGVVVANMNGELTLFNRSAERIVGIGLTDTGPDQWQERYGIFYADGETPMPVDELPLTRAIRGEASDDVEMFIRNPQVPDGVFINVSGRPMQDGPADLRGGVIVIHDVTERVHAEQALMQAFAQGRMEVVDTILHNIGNAINSVSIGVGTVREELRRNALLRRFSALAQALEAHRGDLAAYLTGDPQGRKVAPFIRALAADAAAWNERMTRTVERVKNRVAHIVDIINTQKSFHEGTTARKIVNLRQSINGALKVLAESLASRGIELRVDCARAPGEIRIEESRFHQMLVNLVKNAMEAIDELAQPAAPETRRIAVDCYLQNEFLVIDVVDNGIGIKDDRQRMIFTAGYTTKKDGNGLGLHSAANFVIASGGRIYPLSGGIGKGTTMRVMLRRSSTLPEHVPERTENGSALTAGAGGAGRRA